MTSSVDSAVATGNARSRWRLGEFLLVGAMALALGVSAVRLGSGVRLRLQPQFRPALTFQTPPSDPAAPDAARFEVPPWPPLASVGAQHVAATDAAVAAAAVPQEAGPPADAADDRAARWRFRLDADLTPLEYAQRLDALGIELGVPAGGGKIDYVSALAAATPQRRQGAIADENRLYLTWDAGGLPQADAEFLAKAGIAQQDVVLHFLPTALEEQLAALETAFAMQMPAEIVATEFGIRPRAAGGFEMYVVDQRVRGGAAPAGN